MSATPLATVLQPVVSTGALGLVVGPPDHRHGGPDSAPMALRAAGAGDAPAIHALILAHLAEGHLLPRELDEIARHADRFIVATRDDEVVACAELAPLSRGVSEVRSLVVSGDARSAGVGTELIRELVRLAASAGFDRLCAFTHAPSYFVQLGFSIVPHVWVPEKIVTDCRSCPQFRHCGQYAVVRALRGPGSSDAKMTSDPIFRHG